MQEPQNQPLGETLLETAFELATVGLSVTDAAGRLVRVNRHFADIYGFSPAELEGELFTKIVPPELREAALAAYMKTFSGPPMESPEIWRIHHRDGRPRVFSTFLRRFYLADGTPLGMNTVMDVTDQYRAQEAVRQSEAHLRGILQVAPVTIFSLNARGEFVLALGTGASASGEPLESLVGKSIFDVHRDRPAVLEQVRRALSGQTFTVEFESDSGGYHETHYQPMFDAENRVTGVLGVSADVTERKRTEMALRESETRLRVLAETAPSAIWVARDATLLYANPALEQMTGFSREELLSEGFLEKIIHPDFLEMVAARTRVALRRGGAIPRYEFKIVVKDGTERWLDFSGSSLVFGGEPAVVGVAMDVTERKRAEELLALQYTVTTILAEAPERANPAEDLLREVCQTLDWSMGEVWVVNRDGRAINRISGWRSGEGSSPAYAGQPIRYGVGLIGRVWKHNRLLRGKGRTVAAARPDLEAAGYDSAFAVPMSLGEDVAGVVVFYGKGMSKPEPDVISLLASIGAQVAQYIHRRRAEQQMRANEERFRLLAESAPFGVYITQDHQFVYVNPQFQHYLGYSQEDLVGSDPTRLIHPDDREHVRANAIQMLKGDGTQDYEYRAITDDGAICWVLESVISIDYGGRRAIIGNFLDITERKRMDEALRQSEERYRKTFETLQDVFFETDLKGRFTLVSPSVQRMFGFSTKESVGAPAMEIYADPTEQDGLIQRLVTEGVVNDYEATMLRNDGTTFPASINASVVFKDGVPVAVQGTTRDITERKRAEAALRQSEERLAMHIRNMPMGAIGWDLDAQVTQWNPAAERIFGYTAQEAIGKSGWDLITVEEDNPEENAHWQRLIDSREPGHGFGKSRTKDGRTIICEWYNTPLVGSDGTVIGVASLVQDITEQRRTQEERDRIFDLSADMLAVIASGGEIRRVNPAWERLLGYRPEDVVGRNVFTFVHPEEKGETIRLALKADEGSEIRELRMRFRGKDGEFRWLSWSVAAVSGLGVTYCVARDISDLVAAEREQRALLATLEANAQSLDELRLEAEYLANHDVLTGVINRRAWFGGAVKGRGTAVAIFDIDHFKLINDAHGHPAGDEVLKEVASRLAQVVGEGHLLGRVGGEEFAIFFACPFAEARALCDQAVAAVQRVPVLLAEGQRIEVSVSAGLSDWRSGGLSREDSLARTYEAADRALYAAKQAGRKRLVVSGLRAA